MQTRKLKCLAYLLNMKYAKACIYVLNLLHFTVHPKICNIWVLSSTPDPKGTCNHYLQLPTYLPWHCWHLSWWKTGNISKVQQMTVSECGNTYYHTWSGLYLTEFVNILPLLISGHKTFVWGRIKPLHKWNYQLQHYIINGWLLTTIYS